MERNFQRNEQNLWFWCVPARQTMQRTMEQSSRSLFKSVLIILIHFHYKFFFKTIEDLGQKMKT